MSKKPAIIGLGIFVALVIIALIIALIIYLFTRPSKSSEEKEPKISVSSAELVSTENYTPFEYYTTQELTEFSKNVKIAIKLVVSDSYLIETLKIRRKHGSYAIDTKNLTIKDGEQTIEFSPNENENMVGDHNILVQYTTKSDPNTEKNGATTNVAITGEHLQMTKLDGKNSVELEVTSPTINTQIITSQKLVTVKYNGKDIFDGDDVYLTPIVTDDNNGFKINGTGRGTIQGKIFYFLNAGNKKMIGNKPTDENDTLYITYKDNTISLSKKTTDFAYKLFDVTLTDDNKAVTVSPPTSSSGYY